MQKYDCSSVPIAHMLFYWVGISSYIELVSKSCVALKLSASYTSFIVLVQLIRVYAKFEFRIDGCDNGMSEFESKNRANYDTKLLSTISVNHFVRKVRKLKFTRFCKTLSLFWDANSAIFHSIILRPCTLCNHLQVNI